jgi:TonB family protein
LKFNRHHTFGILSTIIGISLVLIFLGAIKILKTDRDTENSNSKVFSLQTLRTQSVQKKEKSQTEKRKIAKEIKTLKPILSTSLLSGGSSFGLETESSLNLDERLSHEGELVMDDTLVDKKPIPLSQTQAEYPEKATEDSISGGKVQLRMLVNSEGKVQNIKILEASPSGYFEEATLAMVRQWRFKPAEYRGRVVAVWVNQSVVFGEQ